MKLLLLLSLILLTGCGPFNFEVSMAIASGDNQTIHRKTDSKVTQKEAGEELPVYEENLPLPPVQPRK